MNPKINKNLTRVRVLWQMKKNKHSKMIQTLCKEILLPLGVFQKGTSRVYLDDNGYYLTMVEFQPSVWSRGSHLNVGIHFLWNTYDYFSYDAYSGISSRLQNFVEYQDNKQFEREMRKMIALAREQILYFRKPDNVRDAVYKMIAGNEKKNKSLYLAYHGQIDAAHMTYVSFMESPGFSKIAEEINLPKSVEALTQEYVWEQIRKKRQILHTKASTKRLPWREEFGEFKS